MTVTEWVLHHLDRTAKDNKLDVRAAFEGARASKEWDEFASTLEYRGWTKAVDETKRKWRSDRLESALERLGGQTTFGFLDGMYSVGDCLKYTESLTLPEFKVAMDVRVKSREADSAVIKQMRMFLRRLLPAWSAKPRWTLLQIIDLI